MLPVLDAVAMREADRTTIEDLGLPSIVLMENAATGAVEAIRSGFEEAASVLVLAGRGNNGGDGLAVARHLHNGGHQVEVLLFAAPESLSGDAATNLAAARAMQVPITIVADDDLAALERALDQEPDLVVDALLGTGLDRPLAGRLAEVVRQVEGCHAVVVAVDVPTGLGGSSAAVPGPLLPADLTVTFGALKRCHVLPPACLECGEIAVVDIGIPPATLAANCDLWWLEADDVGLLLPIRPCDGHKGNFGHLLVVAGASGRAGAAAMAARAAVVTGAGLVTMAVPAPVLPVVDGVCLEAMTHPLPAQPDGAAAGADPGLAPLLERASAVAIGPGLGTGAGAAELLEQLLEDWTGPMLLDADALNLLAGRPERLAGRAQSPVLTPHPGELGRLLAMATADVVEDRLEAARRLAAVAEAVVVAKGYRTIVAAPNGEAWVVPVGDSHLASGGAGDVLTGTIGALLAQGLEPVRAALVGCWLHGRAGELVGESYPAAAPATQVAEALAGAWLELAVDADPTS